MVLSLYWLFGASEWTRKGKACPRDLGTLPKSLFLSLARFYRPDIIRQIPLTCRVAGEIFLLIM